MTGRQWFHLSSAAEARSPARWRCSHSAIQFLMVLTISRVVCCRVFSLARDFGFSMFSFLARFTILIDFICLPVFDPARGSGH